MYQLWGKLHHVIILLFIVPFTIAAGETGRHAIRTHNLQAPYLDSDLQSRWWDFGGDTVIDANRYVRLTQDRQSQNGYIFSRLPIVSPDFEIEVDFRIHGQGSTLAGDGMAMWLTVDRAQAGPVFGSKDHWDGLAIAIDTYKNGRTGVTFPYVVGMMNDGNSAYDKDHDGKLNEIGGCSARSIRQTEKPAKLRLTYYKKNYLKLELNYKQDGEWIECFNIKDITLPTAPYLGFSAHTGELTGKIWHNN